MRIDHKLWLGIIFFLALFLRLYHLDDYPALNADEAALGYNAYSLLQTGQDEHGNPWPINFESFGDFKPGLSVYLIMPFVYLFGLNELAVRIFPAMLGALTPIILYLFVIEMRVGKTKYSNNTLAILAGLLLAISPWHIHFSRGLWEVNIATFFILAGFLFAIHQPLSKKRLVISVIFFILSMYTYHATRVVAPILGLVILVINRKEYLAKFKELLPAVFVGLLLITPLVISLFSSEGLARAGGVSIFSDTGLVNRINERRNNYPDPNAFTVRLQHNRYVYYSIEFLGNLVSHFDPRFLFISGDEITRNKVPGMGQLYLFEAITVPIGILYIIKDRRKWWIILAWLLIAPVPSALTYQAPHALRSHNMMIPLTIISAFGLAKLIEKVKLSKKIVTFAVATIIGLSLLNYINSYYNRMAVEYPFSSQYGVKELVQYIRSVESNYDRIYVTDRYDQPYILFLFYLQYPPADFQHAHALTARDDFGFSTVRSFDKYHFESIEFEQIFKECTNCLVAGTDEQIPDSETVINNIYFPNGDIAFQITEIK